MKTVGTSSAWCRSRGKRAMDVALAAGLLVVCLPILLALAAVICHDSPGWPLFSQVRIGQRGRRFRMLKLRTMKSNAEAELPALRAGHPDLGPVFKLHDDPRVTRVGHWLRRSSLDELPQLLNVLAGDMSLIGPRPLPPDQAVPDDPRFFHRSDCLPGITGLWQVQGRAMHVHYDRWLRMDCDYVDGANLRLDLWILLRTWPAVVRGDGAD